MVTEFLRTYLRLLTNVSGLFLIVMFVSGILRMVVAPKVAKFTERTYATKKKGFLGYAAALLGGMVTPFCSCSAVPVAISMIESEIPVGVVITFLIAAPVIHEGTVIFMWATMGKLTAVLFILLAAVTALGLGLLLGRSRLSKMVNRVTYKGGTPSLAQFPTWREKARAALGLAVLQFVKLFPYMAISMAFGALIEDYVPVETIRHIVSSVGLLGVIVVTLIGVPLYARIEILIPVGVVLFNVGVPIGTIVAFLMSSSVLSVPEIVMLSKVFRRPLLVSYVGALSATIIAFGYGLNLLFTGHL